MMPRPSLVFVSFFLTFSHLLLPCTSLSQDGLLLLKIKKADWSYSYTTKLFSNWNESDKNPCAWNRISCDSFNTVTIVDLTGAHILGNLTSAICGLPNLMVLILEYNDFSRLQDLSRCKRLRKLNLSGNWLAGRLPSFISQLTELRELNLTYYFSSGHFADELLHLKRLRKLDLSGNPLTGRLPNSISELSELTELNLAYNDFSGPFPDVLLHCKRLRKLNLRSNKFAGTLPIRISELGELEELNLAYNDFSGPFPDVLLHCKRLRKLDLSNNKFAGTLPTRISELGELMELNIAYNSFSGSIPSELQWNSLFSFHISGNKFSGCVPDALDKQAYEYNVLPNPRLCGGKNLKLPSCSSPYKKLAIILVAPLFIVVVALCSICLCCWSRKKLTSTPSWKTTPFISTEVDES